MNQKAALEAAFCFAGKKKPTAQAVGKDNSGWMFTDSERPCCTIPKQDSSLSGADFAQLTCCRTGIPNPVILLIAFTHASASPTCAL